MVERQAKLPDEVVDYDAKDVIEYARTHLPSPVRDAEMPVLEDGKRRQAEEGFSPHKSARLDTADNPGGSTAVDDGATQERETKVPKLSPQGSLPQH